MTGNGLCSPVYTDSLIPLMYFMLSPSSPFSPGREIDTAPSVSISAGSKQHVPGANVGIPSERHQKCRQEIQSPVGGFTPVD